MIKVKAYGIREAVKSAKEIPKSLVRELDRETEKTSIRVINAAKDDAPVDTGSLKNSIDILESRQFERLIGSNLPYAARQEYEHKTNRGFFRRNLFNERNPFRERIRAILRKVSK